MNNFNVTDFSNIMSHSSFYDARRLAGVNKASSEAFHSVKHLLLDPFEDAFCRAHLSVKRYRKNHLSLQHRSGDAVILMNNRAYIGIKSAALYASNLLGKRSRLSLENDDNFIRAKTMKLEDLKALCIESQKKSDMIPYLTSV